MPPVPDRLAAWGQELVEVHDRLRDELDRLLDGLDESPGLTPDLRLHCAAFCGAISRHHTSEDRTAFPALAAQYPELRDTLDGLARDHAVVAEILQRLDEVLTNPAGDPTRVRGQIDGLAAILESHFRWEERTVVAALDGLAGPALIAEQLFGRDV
ncbi:hemerythrin domain-containing protein [Cellulomonas fengjieae]|uniref:Hemerythrin domain-containing protein n=1 Tax=Cellulomonas fengjieae TaxID=2819978 RepID=A0ABS3SH86_9CELL|nr:hemerythrin domain-containing protein [Cellulomonas fengjieae]MBO3085104.1 hemerythrin domain-containing protein [Cellulomonas fengjieae]QVI66314.1 hemerythrin domain-containing protein [Cellulomonas fengjieae]